MKFVFLWTDVSIWLLVVAVAGYAWMVLRRPNLRQAWRKVFSDAPALASSVVLVAGVLITLSDSIHFRQVLPSAEGAAAG